MSNLFNHTGVWFDITSGDVHFETVAREDVISLEITEEMAKMQTGTLSLLDQNNVYSRIIRPGAKMNISWGMRNYGEQPKQRTNMEVMVLGPSGAGAANGQIVYNCSFQALGFRGDNSNQWYESGTRTDIISAVLTRMGVTTKIINFRRGTETVTEGNKVCQHESDFRFLVRMADEWEAAFFIGQDMKGNGYAVFVDYSFIKTSGFAESIAGKASTYLDYGGVKSSVFKPTVSGISNVLSYSWQDNSLDSANGQGCYISIIDGQPQIFRTVVDSETVTTYRLVPELIEKELAAKDLAGRTDLLVDYLGTKSFDEVKRFFVKDTTTTAPQGSGIVVNASLMGDPQITCGLICTFGSGFPDRLGAKDRTWWVRKATHKISTAGYFTDIEIADNYSFSATGIKLDVVGSTQ